MDKQFKPNPVFDRLRGDAAAGEGISEFITVRDGEKIFLQRWMPAGECKRVVVCFHGAGGHGQFFAMFADVLVPRGAAVFVADYRGHGLSGGRQGDYPSFQTLIDDCHDVVEYAKKLLPGKPAFILGESMGGAMAVNYTAQHGGGLDGMILFSPALVFRMTVPWPQILYFPWYLLCAVIAPGRPVIDMTGNEEKGIRNPVHIEYDKTDPVHLKSISTRYFFQLNKYMSVAFNQCPERISVPTILFQGETDPAIDPDGARRFIDNLASSDKELALYPKGLHVLLTDPEAPGIREKLADWVDKH